MKTNYGALPHSNGRKVSLREKPVCGNCGMPYEHHHPSEIEPPKQAYPNHNWCEGCTPENCSGCGTAPQNNPLHDEEWIRRINLTQRGGFDEHRSRATGRSTAIALETIAKAIRHPYTPIAIVDHHPGKYADNHLARMIQDIITRLSLRELYVRKMKDGESYWLQFGLATEDQA